MQVPYTWEIKPKSNRPGELHFSEKYQHDEIRTTESPPQNLQIPKLITTNLEPARPSTSSKQQDNENFGFSYELREAKEMHDKILKEKDAELKSLSDEVTKSTELLSAEYQLNRQDEDITLIKPDSLLTASTKLEDMPMPKTPDHYWDVDYPSLKDQLERGYLIHTNSPLFKKTM